MFKPSNDCAQLTEAGADYTMFLKKYIGPHLSQTPNSKIHSDVSILCTLSRADDWLTPNLQPIAMKLPLFFIFSGLLQRIHSSCHLLRSGACVFSSVHLYHVDRYDCINPYKKCAASQHCQCIIGSCALWVVTEECFFCSKQTL